jgi:serine/threonine-protein kinase
VADQFAHFKTAIAGRYPIERELGRGGMAVVFLAQDRKHDRHVVLKVLRPEVSMTLGAQRFLREVRIAAKLSHPHIVTLIDSDEVDGFLFSVMASRAAGGQRPGLRAQSRRRAPGHQAREYPPVPQRSGGDGFRHRPSH